MRDFDSYNDADLATAELERQANADHALRRRGGCPHGWTQARDGANNPKYAATPDRPRQDAVIPAGMALCLECGASVTDWGA